MQVAEKDVIAGALEMGERLLGGRGAIHAQALGREAFLKKHPETLLIVENEDGASPEKISRWRHRFRGDEPGFRRTGECVGRLAGRGRQLDGEGRATSGKYFGFYVSAMFANDGHADTEPEARSAAGTLGGVEGIEETRKRFGADAGAVILDGDGNLVAVPAGANLDAASVADLADGLLGVGDKIQKDLDQLVGVPDDAGKIGLQMEIHLDIVAAQGMFLQLERALEKVIEVEGLFQRGSGA